MLGIYETLLVGIVSGLLSSGVVFLILWSRQGLIDRFGFCAFKAAFDSLQNAVSKDSWEIRGRIYNNTSMQVYADLALFDFNGQIIGGFSPPPQ